MKKIVIVCGMLSLGLLLANKPVSAMMCHGGGGHEEHSTNEKSQTKAQAQDVSYATVYSCPMHPQVQSDKPGKCPECGMNLEKVKVPTAYLNDNKENADEKTETKEAATPAIYTCPMHPEVQSDKPGKCPKCGMNLVEKKEAIAPCPRHSHSGAQSDCPKCGLKLEKSQDKKSEKANPVTPKSDNQDGK